MKAAASNNNSLVDVKERKRLLRKHVRSLMKEIEDAEFQSQQVWDQLVQLPAYEKAKSITLFLSMPKGEINTDAALQHAATHDKLVYVPEVGKNFEQADMEMIRCPKGVGDFHKEWPTNKWKIPEPPTDYERILAKPGDLDLMVVPGLAFDEHGGRLGQGKGYYDRFIERMRNEGKPILVGVALKPQLMTERLPMSEYDFPMDIVLTPDKTIVVTNDT